jgi:uncharacterized protein (TIGR02246 family)
MSMRTRIRSLYERGRRPLLLAGLLVVCSPVWADAVADVDATTQQWVAAFNRKSAADIVALYAPDAILFGTSSPVLRDTPEKVRDYFKSLADLGDATISIGEHRVQVFGDVAVSSGFYTRSSAQTGTVVKNPARFTFVYQRRAGRWMIVSHHSSALP